MITELIPVTLQLPDGGAPRTEGIHVSSVIRCIAAERGILKAEYVESLDLVDLNQQAWWDSIDQFNQIRIAMGMAWDQWYLSQLSDVIPHPGEMKLDGIYMTPDGESLDFIHMAKDPQTALWVPIPLGVNPQTLYLPTQYRNTTCIHEVKATSKSTKTVGDLFSQWMWLTQLKAYCKAAETLVGYMHVLFIYGDYKRPYRPQLKCWRVIFTQDELDVSWDMITGYVQSRLLLDREDAGLEGGN